MRIHLFFFLFSFVFDTNETEFHCRKKPKTGKEDSFVCFCFLFFFFDTNERKEDSFGLLLTFVSSVVVVVSVCVEDLVLFMSLTAMSTFAVSGGKTLVNKI